jgi:bifunctional DNA primase/polymerase-like protein
VWHAKGFGVGVVLGEASGGLADVDLDAPEAIALADAFLPATGATFGRASKPRSHRIFVADGARTARYSDGDRASIVEIRAAGAQTVFPPSWHPSGERIAWHGAPPRAAVVSADELARRVAALAVGVLLFRRLPRLDADGRARLAFGAVDGHAPAWARVRKALPEHDLRAVQRFVGANARAAAPRDGPRDGIYPAPPAPTRRPLGPGARASREARARAYLAACDPAVSGQNGHVTTFLVVLKIVRGFSRDEADARSWEREWRALLDGYNSRCWPPWSRRELEYKIRDALFKSAASWGFLLDATPGAGENMRYPRARR